MTTALARNYQVPLIDPVKNHTGANVADAYRSLVRLALNLRLTPLTEMDLSSIPRGSVFFPPALAASVNEVAAKYDCSFQLAVAGLAQAAADHLKAKKDAEVIPDRDVPFKARPEQATFYKTIVQGLARSKIVVAEASTGVGKGRALMAAAIQAVQDKKVPVIVAAPTVMVVNQLWGELQKLRVEDKLGNNVSATILPGSTEFADDIKLLEWFNDETTREQDPEVADWIRKGAPHTSNDAIGQVAKEQGITLAWLMCDLNNIASNMPVSDFVLKTDRSDKTINSKSRELLAAIRDAANRTDIRIGNAVVSHTGADIILCTHAMLALGQKTNWAVLQKPKALIVDEAHLLEKTISRMNSHEVSLFALTFRLANFCRAHSAKKGGVARNALKHAKDFMLSCQKMSSNDLREKLNHDPEKYDAICKGVGDLAGMVRSRIFASDQSIQKDMHLLLSNAEKLMKGDRSKNSAYLQFSPFKRYPLISVGADSIGQEAGALWKAADGGVILASATMYITDEYGNQKCDYVVRNLSIPLTRLEEAFPVVAEYIYTLPTLHIPDPNDIREISRPDPKKRKDTVLVDKWLSGVAEQIARITLSTRGGTLVLVNAYDQINGIENHLRTVYPELSDRLVVQKRGIKFAAVVAEFKAAHKEGKHPIWLGLGPAWTGLNLSDEDVKPEKDTLLRNLVIACCPIGLNQSPTMQRRIETTQTTAIAKEALLIFKQGLGRLIRRNHVTDRHIWILDGRIWSDTWLKTFTGPAKRLLSKYKKYEYF